jgi:subtilisin family serine protease
MTNRFHNHVGGQEMNTKNIYRWMGFSVVILILLLITRQISFAQIPPKPAPIDPKVQSEIQAEGETTFWVYLSQQADLSPAYAIQDWGARGQFVVDQLRSVADASQADLRSMLQKRGATFTSFWIVNAIRVTGDAALLQDLAVQPGVKKITASSTYTLPKPLAAAHREQANSVEWNIDRINAPQVWSTFGVRGEGIVVANIDSGVQFDHPALRAQYRGNLGEGVYDHNYNWFDPSAICTPGVPCDNMGHGSHTMGTMLGDDGGENQIGVAPGARWIAAKGCEYDWCTDFALLSSAEWILAPCPLGVSPGDPSCDPARRPQIVNNSWGSVGGNPWFQASVQAWVAAGIFPAFSAGNEGPGCWTAGSPGDYLESYAAGAFDINNDIADFSSRGPSALGGIKPNLAAPGVDVRSSVPYGSGYEIYSGTSMASPHVAGTVALMWSAAPVLLGDVSATRLILDQTAFDVFDSQCDAYPAPEAAGNPNNVWGEGRLDAFAAVELSPRGPTSTLQGALTDANTGQPLADASIQVVGPISRTTHSDENGFYQILLPVGVYDVTASRFAYRSQMASGVTVIEGVITVQDFALAPAPAHNLSGYVFDDLGNPVADATVTILNTPIPPITTDAGGFYSFSGVPEGTYDVRAETGRCNAPLVQSLTVSGDVTDFNFTLPARRDAFGYQCRVEPFNFIEASQDTGLYGDDNATQVDLPFAFSFYGQAYSTAYVSTNGLLNFLEWGSFLGSGSIPNMWSPNAAIYLFWDDLVVGAWAPESSVRTELLGEAPNRQFVIEWRNVQFCCTSDEYVRFEVILYENGEILTQYTSIDENDREKGNSATLGIENETGTIALQYSYGEPAITEGLAVRYIPPPMGWLEGTVTDASTSAPVAGATIELAGPISRSTFTDENGFYQALLMSGDYTVTATAFAYEGQTATGVVIREGETTVQDIALAPIPRHTVSGFVLDEAGAPLQSARVTILDTPLPPAVTDASGYYSFAGVPEGSYTLRAEAGRCNDPLELGLEVVGPASDFNFILPLRRDAYGYFCSIEPASFIDANTILPLSWDDQYIEVPLPFPFTFYGHTYTKLYAATNGYLNFLAPSSYYSNESIPSPWEPNGAIYPFWDDLFVDEGASVRTALVGEAPNRAFVIEWRDVAFCCISVERVRFQVVLYENGQILMQYTGLDPANAREQGESATMGIENETGTIAFQYSAYESVLYDGLAIRFRLPPSGFVQGTVTDANDNLPVVGATISALWNGSSFFQAETDSDGFYRMQLPLGAYDLDASAENYGAQTSRVTLDYENQVITQDYALRTPRAVVSPDSLTILVPANAKHKKILTLQNTGGLDMTWDVDERGGGIVSVNSPQGHARNPDYKPGSLDTRHLYLTPVPGWSPTTAGDILRSWEAVGVNLPWGLGYTGDLWISDPFAGGDLCALLGACANTEFDVFGAATGRVWPADWAGDWNGDMAYDSNRNLVCQVNVGGDNGIYCWDLDTGNLVTSFTGSPWDNFSQRGLAYRPDDDTFYIGGWNDGLLYHVKGLSWDTPGGVLNQCYPPDGSISGLAWNPAFNIVWQATNSPSDTIYELNPDTCEVISTLAHPNPGYNGAGLEMDDVGNLWMVSQSSRTVYLVDSGLPSFTDVPWLSEDPTSGVLAAGRSQQIAVLVDSTGLTPGTYQARLFITTNSGRQPVLQIPVTLIVSAYYQAVNAGGPKYVDLDGYTWSADKEWVAGSWGYVNHSRAKSTQQPISGTEDDPLYQTQRSGVLEYRFDGLPPGIYQVDLRFAEFANIPPNKRVFHVLIEGDLVLNAHDITLEVGRLAADNHTFYIQVTDGQLNIHFVPLYKNVSPVINAIAVIHWQDPPPAEERPRLYLPYITR